MATAYSPASWSDLFVAAAGASAALTGLLFVAVSVNIERILKFEGLPERALQTLLMLLSAVVVSLTALIPGQSSTALGLELLIEAGCFGVGITMLLVKSIRATSGVQRAAFHWLLVLPSSLALTVGGASILAETGGGLYWIAAGIVGALVGASINAWVLLVEILR